MKKATLLICCAALIAAAASTSEGQLSNHGKISASEERVAAGLRGGLQASRVPQATLGRSNRKHSIVALQSSQATHLRVSKSRRTAAKRSHSGLLKRLRRVTHMKHSHTLTQSLGLCRKNKLRWWIKVKRKCVKSFGEDSKWDRNKMDGQCTEAWNACQTGFYAVCCSQPKGAKTMEAYCAKKNLTVQTNKNLGQHADKDADKACAVDGQMQAVAGDIASIQQTISLLSVDIITAQTILGPGPGPAPMPIPTPAKPTVPAGLMPAPAPAAPTPAASAPAAAPGPAAAPAPAAPMIGPGLPTPVESRCARLTEQVRQAAEQIHAIRRWAKNDGVQKQSKQQKPKMHSLGLLEQMKSAHGSSQPDTDSAEAKDPDLVFAVSGVIHVGDKLDAMLKDANFCYKGPPEDDDDDEDDAEVQADLAKDPTRKDDEEDEDEDEDETAAEPVMKINETAIMELLNWEMDMKNEISKFDTDVHPHAYKWWRYRFEYTLLESIVLAFSVIVMYFVMWLLHGVSFFHVHKFYKTGITMRLHRYAWAYFVFHAAALMIMVTFSYMLYTPWGTHNIFDWFALAVRYVVNDRANVPFVGYSWLYMFLDVQFQLFVCFALYSLFVVMVVHNFKKALEDWKSFSDNGEDSDASPRNKQIFKEMEEIMIKRVQKSPESRQIFHELNLKLVGVEGLDKPLPGWNDFKLHLYLTDALGKSVEYLVDVSLTTIVFLACSSLLVAVLAHHFEVAFMYFLPGFLTIGVALFIAGYFVARHFQALSHKEDYDVSSKYVTIHRYCRAVQIVLYCLFYSFSRLLLSYDIFESYPRVYMTACIALLLVLALLAAFAGDVMKEMSCILVTPPHVRPDKFKEKLEQVVYWHSTEKCHECGVQQFPNSSLSREWAGKKPDGERVEMSDSTPRQYTFRG